MKAWSVTVSALLGACSGLNSADGDVLTARTLAATTGGCTPRSEASAFPVKVLFVLENGGSMCVVDPPGSTGSTGFCETLPVPSGLTIPARVRVVRDFIAQASSRPNLFVATSWFDLLGHGTPFASAVTGIPDELSSVQITLGAGHDLQEGLADAVARVEADMRATPSATRARTRYAVVLLGTGTAYPRCSSVDDLGTWASATVPEGVWPDSTSFCNDTCTSGCLVDFTPGGDRNQNFQLRAAVDRLLALKTTYGVGDIRLHTRMVFDDAALIACGSACNDLFAPGQKDIGRWTLQQLAQRGQGTFEEPASLSALSVASVDTTEFTELCPLDAQ